MHTTYIDTIIGIHIDFFSLRCTQRYSEILLTRRTVVLLIIFRRPLISEYYFFTIPAGRIRSRTEKRMYSLDDNDDNSAYSIRVSRVYPCPVAGYHYCYSPSDYARISIICTLNYILIFDLCPRAFYNDATAAIWSRVYTPTHRHEIIRNCWNKRRFAPPRGDNTILT